MDKELDDLMRDHVETNEYVGKVRDWRTVPELDEDPDEADEAEVLKDTPSVSDVHVASPEIESALRARKKKPRLPLAKGAGLYVCRLLQNEEVLRGWAARMGLPPLDKDLHVTVVYSHVDTPWAAEHYPLVVPAKNLLRIESLGEDGAVVIRLNSWELNDRHFESVQRGAVPTYPIFKPHLTLFYDKEFFTRNDSVPTPPFDLVFGEEIAGFVDENVFEAVAKVDDEKRLVTGWASVLTIDGTHTPYKDSQDDFLDEDELVRAAHKFITTGRTAGEMHKRLEGVGTIVESLVVTKALKKAMGLPDSMPTGWLITVKVDDDGTWGRVKSGELSAFSIGGSAIRELIRDQ